VRVHDGDSSVLLLEGPASLMGVGRHGLLPRSSLRGAHLLLGPPETRHHLIQPARPQYPVARELFRLPRAGILRQVTDLP